MYGVIFGINQLRDFWKIWKFPRFARAISKFSKMHTGNLSQIPRPSMWLLVQIADLQFYLKKTLAQVFSCKFCEIFKNTFSYRIPPVAASVLCAGFLNEIPIPDEYKINFFRLPFFYFVYGMFGLRVCMVIEMLQKAEAVLQGCS